MLLKSIASVLNLRAKPSSGTDSAILGELVFGDRIEVKIDAKTFDDPFVEGVITSGLHQGRKGYVRRKWLVQSHAGDHAPAFAAVDRTAAADIITNRTQEFDAITYKLPLDGDPKAGNWNQLKAKGWIDCSGWIHLLAREILPAYQRQAKGNDLSTISDSQITTVARHTGLVVSGVDLRDDHYQAGVLLGIDFAEYSWDRNRALDIDHVVIVGGMGDDRFISQSSSSGGGVHRVPLPKWLASTQHLRAAWRVHAVDLAMLP